MEDQTTNQDGQQEPRAVRSAAVSVNPSHGAAGRPAAPRAAYLDPEILELEEVDEELDDDAPALSQEQEREDLDQDLAELEDVDVDVADLSLEEERTQDAAGSALASYSVDDQSVADGRWTPWPKLGRHARLRIAYFLNERHVELIKKARRKFGKPKRQPDGRVTYEVPEKRWIEAVPLLYSRAVLTGMDLVELGQCVESDNYALSREGDVITLLRKRDDKTFRFAAADFEPENVIVDNQPNRRALLEAFPELQNDVHQFAYNKSNYRDQMLAETVRGN